MQNHNPTVLLVAHAYILPYKVLFCLWDAGVRNVYVLANRRGARLWYTRFSRNVFLTDTNFDGSDPEKALGEINRYVKKLGIDVVLPGDQYSTRLLTMIQHQLATECFPLPDAATYNRLYNKWEFFGLCQQLHIRCPETTLFENTAGLLEKVRLGTIAYPFICKPVDLEASIGVVTILRDKAVEQIKEIHYTPVLVQQFIEGEDIGASVYCENGVIKHFIAHRFERQLYQTFLNDEIYSTIATVMGSLKVSGVFNFDMRLTPEGDIYYLECNPRFFLKIVMSALAGINFVAAGLRLPTPIQLKDGTTVRMPRLVLRDLFTKPYRISREDIRTMGKLVADPITLCLRMAKAPVV